MKETEIETGEYFNRKFRTRLFDHNRVYCVAYDGKDVSINSFGVKDYKEIASAANAFDEMADPEE